MLAPSAIGQALGGLPPTPRGGGVLDFLEPGERTEVPLGPGLVLTPMDLQGESSASVFPHGYLLFWKRLGRQFLNYCVIV